MKDTNRGSSFLSVKNNNSEKLRNDSYDLQSLSVKKRVKNGFESRMNLKNDIRKNETRIIMERIPFLSIYRYAKPFDYFLLTAGILLSLAQGSLQAIQAIIFKGLSETLIEGQAKWRTEDFDELKFHNGAMVAVYMYFGYGIGILILATVSMICWHTVCERQIYQIRKHYFAAVVRQNMGWFDKHPSGELMTKMSDGIDRIKDGIGDKVGILFSCGTAFIGGLVVAFICSWRTTLIMLIFMPILAGLMGFLTTLVSTSVRKELRAYEKAGAVAEEVIVGIRTVIALNGQKKEISRYQNELNKALAFGRRKALFIALGTAWLFCLIFIAMGIAFWYGTRLYNNGFIQPGAIFATFWAAISGTLSLGIAVPQIGTILTAQTAASSIFEVIDRIPEIDCQSSEGINTANLKGEIEFKDVHFCYPTRPEEEVLKGISFKVKAEQSVALVGSSGCGKSTLIGLLLRYYNQGRGELTIDGIPLNLINIRWLRQMIGVVSQEPVLFAATVEENIRLGNEKMTVEEMERVCQVANAHNFIKKLPMGYKTRIGEGGVQLSGGQKQRIAIARALIKDPKILLLDEATTALDTESEKIVQHALKKASAGRTTLTIAHRLSTIRNADHIIVMDHGRVIERGTHEELMKHAGMYMKLVLAQNVEKLAKENACNSEEEAGILEDERKEMINLIRSKSPDRLSRSISTISSIDQCIENSRQEVNEVKAKKESNLLNILRFARDEWLLLFFGLLFAILKGFIFPIFSIIYGAMFQALTKATAEQRLHEALTNAINFIILGISCGFVTFLASYLFALPGELLTKRLRITLFTNIISQDGEYFDLLEHVSGNLITRLATDISNIRAAIDHRLADVFQTIISIIVSIGVAFYYGPKIAPIGILTTTTLVLFQIIITQYLKKRSEMDEMLTYGSFQLATEALKYHKTVQYLTCERYFCDEFNQQMRKLHSTKLYRGIIQAFAFALHSCFNFFNFAAAYRYGLWLIEIGNANPFQVFQVIETLNVASMSVSAIGAYFPEYIRACLSASLIFKMLAEKPKISSLSEGGKKEVLQGNVKLKDIRFAYPVNRKCLVLKGLTMEALKGKTIALVGSSGCGKSTVIQLIERFYDPFNGTIMYDDSDVRHLNLYNVRNQIALVSQEPILFNYSVRENIAYGLINVCQRQIEEAAKQANAHNFIMEMKNGYDTIVGESGGQLSGGQKQCIAIARAIIRNPAVLLLDEATSALDAESEKVVQEALERACKGRTCIIIAHRLSSIQNSDQILVMNDGAIVEFGTHQELLHRKGLYANLIEMENLR
ncbi:ABC transporter transmembrane region family protein [Acanthocheilonema viteae]